MGKKIFVVTAHPDDESFLAAGTIYLNSQKGGSTWVACGTCGEKGSHHLDRQISKLQLAKIRKRELTDCCRLLLVDRCFVYDFPDGKLAAHINKFFKYCYELAVQYRPDLILGFGENGITGHNDHVAASKVAEKLSKKLHIPALEFALPPKIIPNAQKWLMVRRKNLGHYQDKIEYSVPDLKIMVDPKIKLRALKIHKSQLKNGDPLYHYPKQAAKEVLRYECFCTRP